MESLGLSPDRNQLLLGSENHFNTELETTDGRTTKEWLEDKLSSIASRQKK